MREQVINYQFKKDIRNNIHIQKTTICDDTKMQERKT